MADSPLRLAPAEARIPALADAYRARGRVQITDVLELASADAIHRCLIEFKDWNLVFTEQGKHVAWAERAYRQWPAERRRKLDKRIHAEAEQGFQYFFAAVPLDEIYHRKLLPGHCLNRVFELINSEAVLRLVRAVTADASVAFADAQATRYERGHFLTCHDDAVVGKNRRVAYVLNVTPVWRPDWGGALQFIGTDGNIAEAYTPRYNALNLFKVPSDHSVGVVAPFAGASRYSITGWFRSGAVPAA